MLICEWHSDSDTSLGLLCVTGEYAEQVDHAFRAPEVVAALLGVDRRHAQGGVHEVLLVLERQDELVDDCFFVVERIGGKTRDARLLNPLDVRDLFESTRDGQRALLPDLVVRQVDLLDPLVRQQHLCISPPVPSSSM